jgi:proteic killer suppression protein
MLIIFRTERLEKTCNAHAKAVREWGERRARVIGRRLDDLRAAATLADMRFLPGDCHEYKHRMDYTLTLDLDGGKRLFFRPANDPVATLADGVSLDWARVTAIEITGVGDPRD